MTEGKKMDGEHTQKTLMEMTMKKTFGGEKSQNYFCGQLGSAEFGSSQSWFPKDP